MNTPVAPQAATAALASGDGASTSGRGAGRALLLVLALGGLIRAAHVARSDFPLGDGGLFLAIVDHLNRGGFALPVFVQYNAQEIPFGYPPLGFYLAAAAAHLSGATSIEVMRALPLAFSVATLVVFGLLARTVLGTGPRALGAVFAFSVLPLAYRYFIMGAGITRSPGLAFAVLTVWLVYLLCTRQQRTLIPLAATAGALAVMSHPNAAWFAAYSCAIVVAYFGRRRASLVDTMMVAVGVAALSAPWWLTVIERHGVAPFLVAAQSSNPGVPAWALLLLLRLTEEPAGPIILLSGLLGAMLCVRAGEYWLPTWLVAACVLDTRYAGTFAMVPLALLAGVGITAVGALVAPPATRRAPRAVILTSMAWLGALCVIGSVAAPGTALRALPAPQREAMGWVAQHTPADSAFLVVAPAGESAGSESEWFPVLAGRRNLGAYQGSEWLQHGAQESPWQRYEALQACGARDVACIEAWAASAGDFAYVYVRDTGTERLRTSLAASPRYTLAYRALDVSIYQRDPS